MIQLIVFDIDGVLTNGTYTIDSNGIESKTISYKDLDSFNLIKQLKIKTMFITSEKNSLTEYFNKKFKPDVFFDGIQDKYIVLKNYLLENSISFSSVSYVGDGKKDIECIEKVGLPICPSNSINEIKEKCTYVLNTSGGIGVVYDVYKILINSLEYANQQKNEEYKGNFDIAINEYLEIIELIKNDKSIIKNIEAAIIIIKNSLKKGGIIYTCGNESSVFCSEYFATELIRTLEYNMESLPILSINPYMIASITSNYSFKKTISTQINALGKKDDVLFVVSTGNKCKNVNLAIDTAKNKKMKIIVLTSFEYLNQNEECVIRIPSNKLEKINELHIMIINYICREIERNMFYV